MPPRRGRCSRHQPSARERGEAGANPSKYVPTQWLSVSFPSALIQRTSATAGTRSARLLFTPEEYAGAVTDARARSETASFAETRHRHPRRIRRHDVVLALAIPAARGGLAVASRPEGSGITLARRRRRFLAIVCQYRQRRATERWQLVLRGGNRCESPRRPTRALRRVRRLAQRRSSGRRHPRTAGPAAIARCR